MPRRPAFTEEETVAELLRIHLGDRWSGTIGMGDTPMRRHLVRQGYLVKAGRAPRLWKLTADAKAVLVDVPGSGITRGPPPSGPDAITVEVRLDGPHPFRKVPG